MRHSMGYVNTELNRCFQSTRTPARSGIMIVVNVTVSCKQHNGVAQTWSLKGTAGVYMERLSKVVTA